MRKPCVMLLLLAANVCATAFCSEQTEKEYQTAVEKAKAEFDAKVKVAKDKYAVALKSEMEAATKKGDLDGALALRTKLAALTPPEAEVRIGVKLDADDVPLVPFDGKMWSDRDYKITTIPAYLHDSQIALIPCENKSKKTKLSIFGSAYICVYRNSLVADKEWEKVGTLISTASGPAPVVYLVRAQTTQLEIENVDFLPLIIFIKR